MKEQRRRWRRLGAAAGGVAVVVGVLGAVLFGDKRGPIANALHVLQLSFVVLGLGIASADLVTWGLRRASGRGDRGRR